MALTGSLTVDERHLGTPEEVWQSSGRLASVPALTRRPWRQVVVVAPHPDDEVLGAGGLIHRLHRTGTPLTVVAVTDGEGSHPGSQRAVRIDLRTRRASERTEALRRLTGRHPRVVRLGLPDGGVAAHEGSLQRTLSALLGPDDLCVAPWANDGHPDHDSVGRAASGAATAVGCDELGYLVWAWHWATPGGGDLPWATCRKVRLTPRDAARKRWATSAFATQIRPLGPDAADGPVLPDPVLRRSWRRDEVFVVGRPS